MKVEFSTREYEYSHGRKPKGFGSWAFECEEIGKGMDNWLWVNQSTLTDAKKKVAQTIRDRAKGTDIHVAHVTVLS